MWALTYHLEPHYSNLRIAIAKTYQMLTIMDDTYDNYATIQEIELFTRALERYASNLLCICSNYTMICR